MNALPVTLRMPSQDHSAGGVTAWSTFTVHGFLHFDGTDLLLEWAVTATTDEVDGLEVRSEVEALPAEALKVPLERVREVKASTGWWRPHLDLVGGDLTVFFGVPGETRGTVRLRVARGDRARARDMADAINATIRANLPPG